MWALALGLYLIFGPYKTYNQGPRLSKWLPLFQGWVKINFDVANRPNLSKVVSICRNDSVEVLFVHSFIFPPLEPLLGEVNATLLDLKLLAHHSFSYV